MDGLGIVMSLAAACLSLPAPSQPVDRATELMRREAEREAAAREAAFKRVEALPAPPPVDIRVMAPVQLVLRRADGGIMMGGMVVRRRERQGEGHDADPNLAGDPEYEVLEETFDLAVFGTTGDAPSAGAHLDNMLDVMIIGFPERWSLTELQRKRLRLAGRGDIKRLLDRVEEARKTFNGLRADVNRCEEYLSGLRQLTSDLRNGPFHKEDSLLRKTLRRIRREERPTASIR